MSRLAVLCLLGCIPTHFIDEVEKIVKSDQTVTGFIRCALEKCISSFCLHDDETVSDQHQSCAKLILVTCE